jgi:hypothetical protein
VYFYHLLQWKGNATTETIERGPNWAHVVTAVTSVDTEIVIGTHVRLAISSGALSSIATEDEESSLLNTFKYSLLAFSRVFPSEQGYRVGNQLLRSC